jgi:protein arginine kinase activator
MLCKICRQKEATVLIKAIVNGKIKFLNLCDSCAKKKGYSYESFASKISADQYLEKILEHLPDAERRKLKCFSCGSNYRDVRVKNRLGCPICYLSFYRQIYELYLKNNKELFKKGIYDYSILNSSKRAVANYIKILKDRLSACLKFGDIETAAKIEMEIKEIKNGRL